MGVLSVVLLSVFGITAVLLVVLILLQDDQSEGIGGIFGGGSSNQVGNRKGNILTKTTTVLGVMFLVIAFALAWIARSPSLTGIDKAIKEKQSKTQSVEWWKTSSTDQKAPAASVASPVPGTSASPSASAVVGSSATPVASTNPAATVAPANSVKPSTAPTNKP